ncbi:MAG: HDOD domain-containing protein [Desulfobacteraceae bacterium]|nr:HDOD domain-containing protein [Desulfobacteraceae bacterium]
MGLVKVEKLVQGQVLAEDVLDNNSRLLLSKGQAIENKHIRIMKMWGIFEVRVDGADAKESPIEEPVNSQQTAAVSQQVKKIFQAVDVEHPMVKEVALICFRYRLKHFQPDPPVVALEVTNGHKPANSQEMLSKIDRIDIKLPEVPSLVFELNEIIADPMSSANGIAAVVNKSPSLTATLLKIVNSAFYGFRSKIDSISRAVMLIGPREVSNMALGITIMEIFQDIPKEVMDVASFMEHNLACGVVARILAAHANIQQHTEQLFISGMLHDIGRLILCKYFPELAKLAFMEAQRSTIPLLKAEQNVLGCTHVHLGKRLLNKWKLPLALENNVYYHHHPSSAPNPAMAAVLQLADMVVHGLGIGNSAEQIVPSFDVKAWERVSLPASAFGSLINQAEHQLESFRDVLNKR